LLIGVVPQKTVNPDECVALGCPVQVGILDGINTDLQVLSPIEAAMMRALAKEED
jgi:molecular chaperone DnaK (HSP70)